jgi:hypothetical protein
MRHLILDCITVTLFGEQHIASSLCNFSQSPVTHPSLVQIFYLVSTLFSNTLNLCSSLNVGDQVSHPNTKQEHELFWTECTEHGTPLKRSTNCEWSEKATCTLVTDPYDVSWKQFTGVDHNGKKKSDGNPRYS